MPLTSQVSMHHHTRTLQSHSPKKLQWQHKLAKGTCMIHYWVPSTGCRMPMQLTVPRTLPAFLNHNPYQTTTRFALLCLVRNHHNMYCLLAKGLCHSSHQPLTSLGRGPSTCQVAVHIQHQIHCILMPALNPDLTLGHVIGRHLHIYIVSVVASVVVCWCGCCCCCCCCCVCLICHVQYFHCLCAAMQAIEDKAHARLIVKARDSGRPLPLMALPNHHADIGPWRIAIRLVCWCVC